MSDTILEVKNLATTFDTESGPVRAVDDVSFSLKRGQTLGIVGESGSGKSVTALSIMRLLPKPAGKIAGGQILFKGQDLAKVPASEIHKIRGNRISMIFQEPMTALNPVHRIKKQIGETIEIHQPHLSPADVLNKSLELLNRVGIPEPRKRLDDFPHQLSGGMRQRVMIAIALACQPDILIADEPTTALDVTIQAQILDLMLEMQAESGMGILFITHDMGVIAELCDDVAVMYGGRVVEDASAKDLFARPSHPYTRGLLESIPRLENKPKSELATIPGMVPSLFDMPAGCRFANRCKYVQDKCSQSSPKLELNPLASTNDHLVRCHRVSELKDFLGQPLNFEQNQDKSGHPRHDRSPQKSTSIPRIEFSSAINDILSRDSITLARDVPILSVSNLKKHFPVHGGIFYREIGSVKAVDGVSFAVQQGETLGFVGESGCGKSTLGRTITQLYRPTTGQVTFGSMDIGTLKKKALRKMRRNFQMIFQDPFESLNSRHTIGHILEEPFIIHCPEVASTERRKEVAALLDRVGMPKSSVQKYPHEFSGGQRQRIGIARAIALKPKLIVCDEPVSALDVSIQSQILNLLGELQREMELAYLFIAHDLAVVKHISDRVAVMYLGKVVEIADSNQIYENPLHPYTKALISAIPVADPSKAQKKESVHLEGEIPSPFAPPSGCRFHTRCPIAKDICKQKEPSLDNKESGHQVACHFA